MLHQLPALSKKVTTIKRTNADASIGFFQRPWQLTIYRGALRLALDWRRLLLPWNHRKGLFPEASTADLGTMLILKTAFSRQ